MKNLGMYTSQNGKSFDLLFIQEDNHAYAVGPLPQNAGSRSVFVTVYAESEKEAKIKLEQAIEKKAQGSYYEKNGDE